MEVWAEVGDVSAVTPGTPLLPLPRVLVAQDLELRFDLLMTVHIIGILQLLGCSFPLKPRLPVLPVPLQPPPEAADDGQAGILGAGHGAWLWLWLWLMVPRCKESSMTKISGLGDSLGPEWYAGTGYLSGGRMLLTLSRGGPRPQDAAADTQASRQAKHCAHRGNHIEQSFLGFLPL